MTIRKLRSHDAYLEWAVLKNVGAAAFDRVQRVSFLLELKASCTDLKSLWRLAGQVPGMPTRASLRSSDPLAAEYVSTGVQWYPTREGTQVAAITTSRSILESLRDLGVFHGLPVEYSTARWAPPPDLFRMLLDGATVDPTTQDKLRGQVMVVIDDGMAFLNRCFRKSDALEKSRVSWFWDQDPSKVVLTNGTELHLRPDGTIANQFKESDWQSVAKFGYGRELTGPVINTFLSKIQDGALSEDGAYAHLHYDQRVRFAMQHGTHVADLACGSTHPRDLALPPGVEDVAGANSTQIIMVQLPPKSVLDTSGGGLAKHVLDALDYALTKIDNDADVVVNLSYGATGGPHDGNTLFERTMDGICFAARTRLRGFALVLPAGNHFNAAGHGAATIKAGEHADLTMQVRAKDPTETFCELWFDQVTSTTDIEIEVRRPGKNDAITAVPGCAVFDAADLQSSCCAVALVERPAASAGRRMALVSLLPVMADGHAGADWAGAPDGRWSIRIRNKGKANFRFDAWIQRDEAIPHSRYPTRQATLLSFRPRQKDIIDDPAADPVKRRGTGSSISNGNEPIVVGACYAVSGRPTAYTAASPHKDVPHNPWPDLVAPGDLSEIMPGLLAAGSRSGVTVRMNGTSVSAAVVSRAALNLLARRCCDPLDRAALIAELIDVFGAPAPQDEKLPAIEAARLGAGWVYYPRAPAKP